MALAALDNALGVEVLVRFINDFVVNKTENDMKQRTFLSVMMAVLMMTAFVACGDDDKDDGGTVNGINQKLTGGWRGKPMTGSGAIICNFGSNGSLGVAVSNSSGNYTEQNGTYTFTGLEESGVINANWNDGTTEQLSAASITTSSMILTKSGVIYNMERAEVDNSGNDDEDEVTPGGDNQPSDGGMHLCKRCNGSGKCVTTKWSVGCDGTGKCSYCKGRGYTGSGSFTIKCTMCNGTRACRFCDGTGECADCDGTGYTSRNQVLY